MPAKASLISLDLMRFKGKFTCKCTYRGKHVNMLVDTGAAASVLAASLEPTGEVVGHVKCAGAGGVLSDTMDVIKTNDLLVNDKPIKDLTVIVRDIGPLDELGLSGVLGRDVLFRTNVTIDLCKDQIRTFEGQITSGVPFYTHQGGAYFNVKLDGENIEYVIFDTGASLMSVDLETALKGNFKEHPDMANKTIVGDSEGNVLETKDFIIDRFEFGPIVRQNVKVNGHCLKKIAAIKQLKKYGGILGMSILDGHIFTFDFDSKLCQIIKG